jgi:hypothetical protein
MYRTTKKRLTRRLSISAVVAIGALATGLGAANVPANASTNPLTHAASSSGGNAAKGIAPNSAVALTSIRSPESPTTPGPVPPDFTIGNAGIVVALTGTSITIQSPEGTTTVFTYGTSTPVFKDRAPATTAALALGERVHITPAAGDSSTAARIEIHRASVMGQVVSVNGNTITVSARDGFSHSILVSDVTTYTQHGSPSTLASVKVGSFIFAEGNVDPNHTTLDASVIGIGPPSGAGNPAPGGPWMTGRGGHGDRLK